MIYTHAEGWTLKRKATISRMDKASSTLLLSSHKEHEEPKDLTSFYFTSTALLLVEELQTSQDAALFRCRLLRGVTTGRRRVGGGTRRRSTVSCPDQIVHFHLYFVHLGTLSAVTQHGMRSCLMRN